MIQNTTQTAPTKLDFFIWHLQAMSSNAVSILNAIDRKYSIMEGEAEPLTFITDWRHARTYRHNKMVFENELRLTTKHLDGLINFTEKLPLTPIQKFGGKATRKQCHSFIYGAKWDYLAIVKHNKAQQKLSREAAYRGEHYEPRLKPQKYSWESVNAQELLNKITMNWVEFNEPNPFTGNAWTWEEWKAATDSAFISETLSTISKLDDEEQEDV